MNTTLPLTQKPNSIKVQEKEEINIIEKLLSQENIKKEITKIVKDAKIAERLVRMMLTECRLQPKLLQCTKDSIWAALLKCAEVGLEPSSQMGHIHLIPYENKAKGIIECQVIIGYKGMIALAYRTGEVKEIYTSVIYENDKIEILLGTDSYLRHVPTLNNRGKVLAYYAYCKLMNGGELKEILLPEDIERIKQSSKGLNNPKSPWHSHYDSMARKTCIRQLYDSLPSKSTQIISALAHDTAIDLGKESPVIDYDGAEIINIDSETGEVIAPDKADALAERINA